jgi:hypothetical protein
LEEDCFRWDNSVAEWSQDFIQLILLSKKKPGFEGDRKRRSIGKTIIFLGYKA